MDIALLGGHPSYDGGDVVSSGHKHWRLAESLSAVGDTVTVYGGSGCDEPELSEAAHFAVRRWQPGPFDDEPIRAMADSLRRSWLADRPDVVHAFCWMCGLAAQVAAKPLDLPVVQSFGSLAAVASRLGRARDGEKSPRQRLEPLVARDASWLALFCSLDIDEVARAARSRARISLVSNGIDAAEFSTDGPSCQRGNAFRILVVVRQLQPDSNVEELIKALPRLGDCELVVVGGPALDDLGDDPTVASLRVLADSVGVGERVHWLGAVSHQEMPGLLRSADVFVTASSYKPASEALLEAMACGVPILAVSAPGTLEALVPNITGCLVTPGDGVELVSVLRMLAHQPFARTAMGLAGRARARACFTWEVVAHQRQAMYARAVESFGRQPLTV